MDAFYQSILQVPELKGFITAHSTVGRLRKTLITHMLSLFNGVIDDDFVKLRTKVAKTHYRIGLQPGGIHPVFKMYRITCKELSLNKPRMKMSSGH